MMVKKKKSIWGDTSQNLAPGSKKGHFLFSFRSAFTLEWQQETEVEGFKYPIVWAIAIWELTCY